MISYLLLLFSFLLSLGAVSDMFLPFVKEGVLVIILVKICLDREYILLVFSNLIQNLFLIGVLLYLFFIDVVFKNYSFHDDVSTFNSKFLFSIIFFVVFSSIFQKEEGLKIKSLFAFALGGVCLSVLYGLGVLGESFYEIRNERLLLFGENPNSLSVRIVLSILFLVWIVVENKLSISLFKRFLLLLPIPFMFNLVLFSGSKGSFLLMFLSILIYLLLQKKIKREFKIALIIVSIIGSVLILMMIKDSALYERFTSGGSLTTGRVEIWEAAINIFSNNVFGVGELGYKNAILIEMGKEIDTHNLFVYLLVTGGGVCLSFFLVFLFKLLKKCILKFRYERNIIDLVIFISMVFVMSKTGGVLTYLIMWYFLATINYYNYKEVN